MTYPIQGCVDGARGDHILIAPPFTITTQQIHMLVSGLVQAIGDLEKNHLAATGGSSALL
jgi:adenosylmethionine-8-amino-7-oxononanoate aminotransferase